MSVAAGVMLSAEYGHWLPGWLESVEALDRAPDEVVAVTTTPKAFPSWVRTVKPPRRAFDWCDWRNALADACDGHDYLAWVDVDDRYRPCALTGCGDWTADVVGFGIEFVGPGGKRRRFEPSTDRAAILSAWGNLIPVGSPVRVDLARRVRWRSEWDPYADWGFWVQAAAAGASFSATGRVDVDYRWHADSPTDGGVRERLQAWVSAR